MRLFTALDISTESRESLAALLAKLKPAAPFQWSPLANLHITTKFIGEWPPAGLPGLISALQGVQSGPIEIAIRGLGWFPTPHSPRVLFAAIHAGPALPQLARDTDAACAGIGVPVETKPFSPHLTLARIKAPAGLPAVRQAIATLDSAEFGQFTASAFHLYESTPAAGGSVYTKLEEFPLQ